MIKNQYFERFSWAVPRAFSGPISNCMFEEGDVLYDSVSAYTLPLKEFSGYYAQVRFPSKSSGGKGSPRSGTLSNNWNSKLFVEVFKSHKRLTPGQIETTQGRFYTMLWKGDLGVLDINSVAPKIPLSVGSITKQITLSEEFAISMKAEGSAVFVMAYDGTNRVTQLKYQIIKSRLRKNMVGLPIFLSPEHVGFPKGSEIAPTAELVFFTTKGLDKQALHDLVKSSVYKPAKDSKTDNFKIKAHGLIV